MAEAVPPPPPPGDGPLSGKIPASQNQQDSKYAFLLTSPFALMFKKTGAQPTVKQMVAIMNGILMNVVNSIKQQDAEWKKVYEKMKREIKGEDN